MLSASKFFLKRSYTPGSVPLSSDLGDGELAINLADKKIFFKDVEDRIRFLEISPYSFLSTLSSVLIIEGNNTVTGVFSQVLGGYNNDVSGGGSTVINGENNDIEADFSFIINGLNNLILSGGDYGGILGGQNNVLNHPETFILGSNITSHLSGVTYVNNLSATGKIYGDGSGLMGVTGGSLKYQEVTTNSILESNKNYLLKTTSESITATLPQSPQIGDSLTFFVNVSSPAGVLLDINGNKVNSNQENILCDIDAFFTLIYENSSIGWNFLPFNLASVGSQTVTYLPLSTFQSLSGNWQESYTITQSNSANWNSVYTTVQNSSASWLGGGGEYLHLSGGTLTGNLSVGGTIYGDGSNLTGIVAGDTEATTLVRTNSASWNAAAEQRASRRFDYVAGSPVSFSYSGVAGSGALDTDPVWDVTRVAYTDVGSVSATQYVFNITWVSRLTATYS